MKSLFDRYKKELMDMSLNEPPNHQKLSEETYDKFLMENPKSGELKIQASIAQGLLPIPDISVTVKKHFADQEKVFFQGKTFPFLHRIRFLHKNAGKNPLFLTWLSQFNHCILILLVFASI